MDIPFRAIQIFADFRFARRVTLNQQIRSGRGYRDGAPPVTRLTVILGLRPQAGAGNAGPTLTRRYCSAHASRDHEVVCGRVELAVDADMRLGLAPRERRYFTVRFLEHLHPVLRGELTELVRRRGAVARRAAERMEPIELVFDDPRLGLQRIIGWIQPPQQRNGGLQDIEFGLREPTP